MEIFDRMATAVEEGNEEESAKLAKEGLEQNIDPFEAIQNGFARGMHIIGDKFARLDCFLPEVMMAAEAMNAAIEILRPRLLEDKNRQVAGTVVLGTIQGDLHDLGKNIVKIMLQAAGFTVYDLGADVPVRAFIDKAEEVDADIIAASAILTTTMSYMPDLVSMLDELNIRDRYRVMVGGAPVIPEWAEQIGADGYGEDAAAAVQEARRLTTGDERGEK
jgi:corrinoid protein of di/trimethylamine methyltransferase